MKILFDETNYVVGYANDGFDITGGEEFTGVIPEGFGLTTCKFYYRSAPGVLLLDETKQQIASNFEAAQDELESLYRWFGWYDQQVMQCTRAKRMSEAFSAVDSSERNYNNIDDLDAQAKIYQLRIREIRGGMAG